MPYAAEAPAPSAGREERFHILRPFGLRRAWTFRRETTSPKQLRKSKLQRRKLSRILTIPDFSRLMAPPPLRRGAGPAMPAHAVTEDTPPDMLEGKMALSVLLPDGQHCRINVDRGTPMMDLLIQVTTANKISPGGHVIQVISDRGSNFLSYKPSTPIGTLDTTALRIVPKNKLNELPSKRPRPPPTNPLADAKIRIKVYLPRNQLSAMRVSAKTPLAEVLDQICKEKNLDVSRYELRHPVNVDERLRPSCCLDDYKLQEVTVVPRNSRTNTVLSSADILAMQKKSDGKRKIFAIFGKKTSKPSVIESTASSDSLGDRSVSPDGSDESADRPRSLSPQPQVIQPPPRSKKRAAPKPPPAQPTSGSSAGLRSPAPPATAAAGCRPPSELSEGADSVESRQSSDSSGYHEAGLSDTPDSPTERVSAPAPASSNLGSVASYSTSNLTQSNLTQVNSTSTVSLSSAIRKRRAPQPPPIPRIVEDPQSQSQSQPRQSPEHRTPQSASRPVVGPPVEASPDLAAAASCSPLAAAVPPQPLRRSSLGARRPQPLPRSRLFRQLAEERPPSLESPDSADASILLPPPPGFGDRAAQETVTPAVRMRTGGRRGGTQRPASVGGRPSRKRAPAPPPPPLLRDSSLPCRQASPLSPEFSVATEASWDMTDVTSLSSFRSVPTASDGSSIDGDGPSSSLRPDTIKMEELQSDGGQRTLSDSVTEEKVIGGDVDTSMSDKVAPVKCEQQTCSREDGSDNVVEDSYEDYADSPHCFVIHRWRNSTNLDQLVAEARGDCERQDEDGEPRTSSSSCSSTSTLEKKQLNLQVSRHNSATSTETLTSSQSAGLALEASQSHATVSEISQSTTAVQDDSQSAADVVETSQSAIEIPTRDQPVDDAVRKTGNPDSSAREVSPCPSPIQETMALPNASQTAAPSGVISQPKDAVEDEDPSTPSHTSGHVIKSDAHALEQSPFTKEHVPTPENGSLKDDAETPKQNGHASGKLEYDVPVAVLVSSTPKKRPAPTVAQMSRAQDSSEEPRVAPTEADRRPSKTEENLPVVLTPPAQVLESVIDAHQSQTETRRKIEETFPVDTKTRSENQASATEQISADIDPAPGPIAESSVEESAPATEDAETRRLQREAETALQNLDSNLDLALAESDRADTDDALREESLPSESREVGPVQTDVPVVPPEQSTLPVEPRSPDFVSESSCPSVVKQHLVNDERKEEDACEDACEPRETLVHMGGVVETLLPISRVAAAPSELPTEGAPPATSAEVSDVASRRRGEEVTESVVAEEATSTATGRVTTSAVAVVEPSSGASSAVHTSSARNAVMSEEIYPTRDSRQPSRLNCQPEVLEEVVEKMEKVQRNRMTSKDIEQQIERRLATFQQSRPVSSPASVSVNAPVTESGTDDVVDDIAETAVSSAARVSSSEAASPKPGMTQLVSPPATPSASESADCWEYQLPAPPTPFADGLSGRGPLEAPLQFQDSMTVTSSELSGNDSEVGDLAEATNEGILQTHVPADTNQSAAATQLNGESEGVEQQRPTKPERRRSSERLARQMSFSIGAYGQQREGAPPAAAGTAPAPPRLQKAESFHHHQQKQSAPQPPQTGQPAPPSDRSTPEVGGARRPLTRRRSSDAAEVTSRGHQRSDAGGEPVRPPRKYELKFNNSKSCSMMNLSGTLSLPTEDPSAINKTQSQTDLAVEGEVSDIQSEFLKLQRQFLHWQQQLLHNQSVLQTKVAPLAARPAAASLQSLQVIEELRRRGAAASSTSTAPAPAPVTNGDYTGRSQSLPRAVSVKPGRLAVASQQTPQQTTQRPPEPRPPASDREKRVPYSPPKVALGSWKDQGRAGQVQLKEDRDYVLRHPTVPAAPEAVPPAPAAEPLDSRRSSSTSSVQDSGETSSRRSSGAADSGCRRAGPVSSVGPDGGSRRAASVSSLAEAQRQAEQVSRRSTPVSVRQSKSVTVTSLGAPPPPVSVAEPAVSSRSALQPVSAVAKVRQNAGVPAPQTVAASARTMRPPPAFTIADSKPVFESNGRVRAGRFTSVVSLTEEPKHTVSVQVSKPATAASSPAPPPASVLPSSRQNLSQSARPSRPLSAASVTCQVTPASAGAAQNAGGQRGGAAAARTLPSVVSVTRKDSATCTEAVSRPVPDASWRTKQPVVKGFRTAEVAPSVSVPPPPPPPVLPALAAGRARLKPVSTRTTTVPKLDPREELMIAIREHGGLKSMRSSPA